MAVTPIYKSIKDQALIAIIQDVRVLEFKIYEAVDEYISDSDAYDNPKLHVYLDKDYIE